MTAQILHMRDYKTKEEREAEINRIGLAIVSEALGPTVDYTDCLPRTEYTAPDKDSA